MVKNRAAFAACTVIAKNQLPMARVLAQAWESLHPDSSFMALLLDSARGFFHPEREPFRIILSSELPIPNLQGFFFRHMQEEAAGAIKPFFFSYLFSRYPIEHLIYLAPESLVLNPLDDLSDALSQADVVLTPHIISPVPRGDVAPSDSDVSRIGSYAPGCLALRRSARSDQILQWWSEKISDSGNLSSGSDIADRWLYLAPHFFRGVEVFTGPGYNIGYGNLQDDHVRMDGEQVLVNGEPARLVNFRGFDPKSPSGLSISQNRHQTAQAGNTFRLLARYYDLLMEAGWAETSHWRYSHDFFSAGPMVPVSARLYYRSLRAYANELGDPFTWISDSPDHCEQGTSVVAPPAGLPFGMNVLGHLRSEKGVGEMVRSNLRVLEAARIPFVAVDFVDQGSANVEQGPATLSTDSPYKANLLAVNADVLPYYCKINPNYLRQRFNIGYWAWELPEFPHEWATSFGCLDEVWTLSRFARDSIASSSPIPVHVVHCSLDPEDADVSDWNWAAVGVPRDAFVFLFVFDFHSFVERKNPVGLIRAFKNAFEGRKDIQLVIKSSHGQEYPQQMDMLKEAASGANVHVIDGVYSRKAKNALINAADCYVSLHRSEGFGLTLAEAMFYGKPAVATGYSGNVDFMSSENSFLIPYKIVTIESGQGPYSIGAHWADPDLDHAVDVFRYVERNREAASDIGKRGRDHVSTVLHPATIGRSVALRLQELGLVTQHDSWLAGL